MAGHFRTGGTVSWAHRPGAAGIQLTRDSRPATMSAELWNCTREERGRDRSGVSGQASGLVRGARARSEPYGVWGGRLFFKGKVLAFKRPRGRPPKTPRATMIA